MELAQDLLRQAVHLSSYQGTRATQADYRRAVSTSYYALFHLLAEDAGQRWQGGSVDCATGIQRCLQHGPMRDCSIRFQKMEWVDWHGTTQNIPLTLQRVATAFVDLQGFRHLADYDNQKLWTLTEVQSVLNLADAAVEDWQLIKTHPMAGNYLLSMLLSAKRR